MSLLGRWLGNREGGLAINAAIGSMLALMGCAVALDINRAQSLSHKVQSALDAAVIAAATTQGSDELRKLAAKESYLENLGQSSGFTSADPVFVLENTGRVTGEVTGSTTTMMMGMFGKQTMDVTRYSEAMAGNSIGPLELVFSLDYSSSMNGQYEAMRDAVTGLIDTITNNGVNNNVKIGLVPYAKHVYIDIPGEYSVSGTSGVPWSNCTYDRAWPWNVSDLQPNASFNSKFGLLSESSIPDPQDYIDECTPYTDNNLITRGLTTDHAGTIAQVEAMTPYSGTNVALGAEIAFQVISPNAPYDQAAAYESGWKKVIILMSDGRHNKKGHGPGGEWSEEQGIANIQIACDNIKAKGILMITVAYELDDEEGKAALENCASSSQYYLEGEEENIGEQFQSIVELVSDSEVRLTR